MINTQEREDTARYFMWNRIIGEKVLNSAVGLKGRSSYIKKYCKNLGMTNMQFNPAQEDYDLADMYGTVNNYRPYKDTMLLKFTSTNPIESYSIPISPSNSKEIFGYAIPTTNPNETKKEHNMGCSTDYATENSREKANHLWYRKHDITSKHKKALEKKYNMNFVFPKTYKEWEDMLTNGTIVVSKNSFDKDGNLLTHVCYGTPLNMFEVVNLKKDKEGFNKASELLDKASTKASDDITILPPEQALQSLREYEAMTF